MSIYKDKKKNLPNIKQIVTHQTKLTEVKKNIRLCNKIIGTIN